MNYSNIFLFITVISSIHIMGYALNAEAIRNGIRANVSNFPYQVAIFGRTTIDAVSKLLCGGAIVSPSWILSVAHCFMSNTQNIKNLIFTAVVGSSAITTPGGSFVDIIYIYTYDYNSYNYANDITMAKTKSNIILSETVREIGIATPGESFLGKNGLLAGYGCHKVRTERFNNFLVQTDTDLKLRNITVRVESLSRCYRSFAFVNALNKFCGVANYSGLLNIGVCADDIGTPLVIDNKVIGLAGTAYADCCDTVSGSLYVNVTSYYNFIENVMKGNHQDSWILRPVNRELYIY